MKPEFLNIIKDFAIQYKIDWRILYAILKKESNASGFYKDGTIKERFEAHIFDGFIGVTNGAVKHPQLPGLDADWIKSHLGHQYRLISTSYGIAQIMGYWYPTLNYNSIDDMIDAWTASEEVQIRDFCLFCVRYNYGKFLVSLKDLDYPAIAKQYNGGGYKKNNYDTDLIKFVAEETL